MAVILDPTVDNFGTNGTRLDILKNARTALNKALMIRELVERKHRSSSHTERLEIDAKVRGIEQEIREAL